MDDKIAPKTSIHTLETDLATAVRDKDYGKNIIKIVTDPNKNSFVNKNPGESTNKTETNTKLDIRTVALILFSVLIIGSIITFYILYRSNNSIINDNINTDTNQVSTTTTKNSPTIKNNNILNPEIIKDVDLSNRNKVELISDINNIKNLVIENKISPYNNIGIQTNIGLPLFMEKIRYSGELSLIRALSDEYYFGLYSMPDNKFETYALIKVNDFDLAFKSMLGWEKYMPVDLKDIFKGNNIETQSTTTIKYKNADTINFIDKVIKNHDVREYIKNSDDLTIVYGFINNKYVLITSGESSFIDIKDRLLKENISR